MVRVNDSARVQLRKMVVNSSSGRGERVMRLKIVDDSRLVLAVGKERDGDEVIEHKGTKILAVSEDLTETLDGVVIDYKDTRKGPKLVFSGFGQFRKTGGSR